MYFLQGNSFPRITIITPSYNQGSFLEQTIQSVLGQGYPNLEYIIVDGGSIDGSVEIIKRYEKYLAYWVSEPDGGQYDAINKGFRQSTGEIMAWINSDDNYYPWTFSVVSDIFSSVKEIEWLTTVSFMFTNQIGQTVSCVRGEGFNATAFYRGRNSSLVKGFRSHHIQQESTFWRRTLWIKAGAFVDTQYHLASDFDLWARFFQYTQLYATPAPLGGFRVHGTQKTSDMSQYNVETQQILLKYGYELPSQLETWFLRFCRRYPGILHKRLGWAAPFVVYDQKQRQWATQTRYFV